jgi:signal transduction histidine kinase
MSENASIDQLRQALAKELSNPDFNIDEVLKLSSQLAVLDNDNVRFSIDAGIIDRLGKELVGRRETALSELVKNGYDADASEVKVYFIDCEEQSGGTIVIDDNGTGMSREQLINGFMRISSADKVHNPKSGRYKRTRAGRKGIGRFATQRLGEALELVTQTKEMDKALRVIINWNDFERDIDLSLISSQIQEIDKTRDEGTVLTIKKSRERWNEASVKRAYRYIADLLQPFPLSKTLEKLDVDPGFKSTFYRGDGAEAIEVVDERTAFYGHALAEIEGYVDDFGKGYWNVKSDKVQLNEEHYSISGSDEVENVEFVALKNVHFKAYYFLYEHSLLSNQVLSYIRDAGREYGGIRLYRNGFRVLPYGEKNDDWLGLDLSVRKRSILPGHGNNNFFGFVELIDKDGAVFEETSSREGLLSNKAFEELQDFVYRVILEAVVKVAASRGKKARTNDRRQPVDNLLNESIVALEELAFQEEEKDERKEREYEDAGEQVESGYSKKEKYQRIIDDLKLLKGRTDELLDELSLTRILAGLGLTITQFVHEIKHYIPAIELDLEYLSTKVDGEKDLFDRLMENIGGFTSYTSYFDDAVSQNVLRELHPIELRDVVNAFRDAIDPELKRSHITLVNEATGYDLFTLPMHKSEWASILMNFYTNSRKAIKRKHECVGEILIKYGKTEDKVFLEFSDNGDGIVEENFDKIFDAFYTTSRVKGGRANVYQEVVGTGLGLKIVKDIVEGYNGEIYAITPSDSRYSTTIRVELPKGERHE